MRSKDIELMNKIKRFAEDFYIKEKYSPSTTVIAKNVGSTRGTIYRYLVEMNEKDIIKYNGKDIITNITEKVQNERVGVPICGSISCGSPIEERENIETIVSLPVSIFGTDDMFILKANGDSMINAGIDDEDYVVVSKQSSASDGDIVVALVENESTLKRFYTDKTNHKVILHPENESYKDIVIDSCVIQGVAKFVIKGGIVFVRK